MKFDSIGILAAESVDNFSGLHQHGALLSFRVVSESEKFWIPSSFDLTAGSMESRDDGGSFISFGPSYRFELSKLDTGRWFAEFGVHPTWLTRTVFNGRYVGGNFHFTSTIGLGAYLGRQRKTSVLFRYQHTSNAGMERNNPGFNMIGITLSYHMGRDQQLYSSSDSSPK